jgi:AraC-like DNA-binding protein
MIVAAHLGPFRQFFRARLRFDAERNALIFSSSWLTRVLPDVHPSVRRLVQKHVNALEVRHEDDFPEQVRAVLRTALATGNANAGQVAGFFSIHPRTLDRRLNAFGIGYQELVDETRFAMARQTLESTNRTVSEIAMLLHYSDVRSFIRAFRRWSGSTPARWRATARRPKRRRQLSMQDSPS